MARQNVRLSLLRGEGTPFLGIVGLREADTFGAICSRLLDHHASSGTPTERSVCPCRFPL
jgi:hypothetical protein